MDISGQFEAVYRSELAHAALLPEQVEAIYCVKACLKSSEDKEVYLLALRDASDCVILRRLPAGSREINRAEFQILSSLDHPRIPKALNLIEEGGFSYLIREHVPGVSLNHWVAARGVASEREAIRILLQLCDLVTYLHTRHPPVIHRDIKPQNVILAPDGSVHLIDFDISRTFDPAAATDTTILGTVATAPPEQYGYAQTDARSDIYALGALLIFLMTGHYGRSALSRVSPRLRKIAEACTQFAPEDRYASAARLKWALIAAGRRTPIQLAAAFLSLCVLSGAFFAGTHFSGAAPHWADAAGSPRSIEASEAVTFADAGIELIVREALNKAPGETVTRDDLYLITELSAVGDPSEHRALPVYFSGLQVYQDGQPIARGGIRTLSDLKGMANLRSLTLAYQRLDDLSPLSKLPIQDLSLTANFITDLSPLRGMAALARLNLDYNPAGDLSPLAGLSRLSDLSVHSTNVTDISVIEELPGLTNADLSDIPCVDYSALSSLPKLRAVNLSGASPEDAARISLKEGLRELIANNCGLSSLEELSSMPDLEKLVICGMQILDLNGIERFPSLRDLELSHDPIRDLSPLKALGHLEVLDLRDTGKSLDLGPLLELPTLKRLVLTPDMRAQAERCLDGVGFEIVFAE